MRRIPLLILILCTSASSAFSQGEVPVDMYTGQPSISIPIWTVSSGDVSQPVVLSYNANGALQNNCFGAGWNMSTGSVSREVRSYPDDDSTSVVKGWLYKNPSGVLIATDVNDFTLAVDDSVTWDAGEGTDHTKIRTYANETGSSYAMDTEPDIFSYSAGGLSGSFVFDKNRQCRTIPYADVVITPTYTGTSNKKITKFIITTNDGYKYTFDHLVSTTFFNGEKPYLHRNYYRHSDYTLYTTAVTYTTEWMLTKIESPNGSYVTLTYSNFTPQVPSISQREIGLYQYPDPFYANPSDILWYATDSIVQTSTKASIASITGSTGSKVEFNYATSGGMLQSVTISDDRRGSTAPERKIKTFAFEYLFVSMYDPDRIVNPYRVKGKKRTTYDWFLEQPVVLQFLNAIRESSGCESVPPYTFTYAGIQTDEDGVHSDNIPPIYLFGPEGSDQWGFSNAVRNYYPFPKLYIYPSEAMINRYRTTAMPGESGTEYIVPGANRNSSPYVTGALRSLTTPEGGVTEFTFEDNRYLDPFSETVETAGGLRIKQISYYDGFNQTPIVKTFEYVDPVTGKSSGRIIRKPALVMPSLTWKSPGGISHDKTFASDLTDEEKYQHLLVRREVDLSAAETTHGNTVGYKIVTVRRPGAGYARFEFLMPATYGDAATGDWAPTVNKFARSTSGVDMGIVDGANTWGFPFSPNPNYDFERGLISKKTDYSANNKKVQQTVTAYQRLYKSGSAPHQVLALKYDRYPGSNPSNKIFFYGKYVLLTDVISVPAKEVITRYDLSDTTNTITQKDSIEYLYEGVDHRLLTQVKRYTADGNLHTTRMKYPKDYTTSASGATDAVAIHTIKSNSRYSMPIETIQTFKKAGNDSVWVTGGSVVKLDAFSSVVRVRSAWALKASPPIYYNNFNNSTVVNASGYKFRIDSRYERTDSILSYNALGNVTASYNPVSRKSSLTGYGYTASIPVVQLMNAKLNNVSDIQAGFSDFETTTGYEFTATTSYFGTGRTGLKAFYPKELLNKVVTRAPVVNNYILGFWVKSNTTFTLVVTLRPAAGGTAYSTVNVSIPNTSSEFNYVQQVIPLTGVPAAPATFRVDLQAPDLSAPPTNNPAAGGTSASLLNVIDDVFFYPENAEMAAMTYTIPYGTASVTSGSGSGTHTEYDKLGRPRIVYDKDKNIVSRTVYQYVAQSPLIADFVVSGTTVGETTTFTAATNDCVTDATYEWDIGADFTSGTAVKTVTFDSLGEIPVTLRVTSVAYGTKTITKSVFIESSPFTINICAKGVVYFLDGIADLFGYCSAISEDPEDDNVIFKVTVSGSADYQWQKRDLGSISWVNVGLDRDWFKVINGTGPGHASYEVRCKVTKTTGAIGYSPIMQVIYEY